MNVTVRMISALALFVAIGVMQQGTAWKATSSALVGAERTRSTLAAASERGASAGAPAIRYRVLLSGRNYDSGTAIAVDRSGDAYIVGDTASKDFPLPRPLMRQYEGRGDVFVLKLTPAGKVLYGTYLGGKQEDFGTGIAVDAEGDAWLTGWTRSADFPTTSAAFQ